MTAFEGPQARQAFPKQDDALEICSGACLYNLLQAGKVWLGLHVKIVDSLNVFPVPDGDTGINMMLTLRSALKAVAADDRVDTVAQAVAHGALLGARGNSGVILSQFLQGVAQELTGHAHLTPKSLANALEAGATLAYQSVMQPVEGTILTVMQAAATAAQSSSQAADLPTLLTRVLEAARAAQAKTPELLPVLKQAGVTDSGGQGFVYMLEGALRFINNEPLQVDHTGLHHRNGFQTPADTTSLSPPEQNYGYDVQFLIQGEGLDVARLRSDINRLGWSTLVVGNEQTVKVHLHTHDPGEPLSYGARQGLVRDVVVENMQVQAQIFSQNKPVMPGQMTTAETGPATIAVVSGSGFIKIFESLGVTQVVFGDESSVPPLEHVLKRIDQIRTNDILILPNGEPLAKVAGQVRRLSNKKIEVVPTQTIPQGVAAMLSLIPEADLQANLQQMTAAAQQVRTIQLRRANHQDASLSPIAVSKGDVVGWFEGQVAGNGPSYERVLTDILTKLEQDSYELVTFYYGQMISKNQAGALAQTIANLYPDLETEVHYGGQNFCQYIISVE